MLIDYAPEPLDSRYYFHGRIDTGGDDLRYSFARMTSWVDDLPHWCDQDEPALKALQAAFWVRILHAEINRLDSARQLPNWLPIVRKGCGEIPYWRFNVSLSEPADWFNLLIAEMREADSYDDKYGRGNVAAVWRSLPEPRWAGPQGYRLAFKVDRLAIPYADEQYRYELSDEAFRAVYCVRDYGVEKDDIRKLAKRPRVITPDDVHAARIVIAGAQTPLLWKFAKKKRLRICTSDWDIVKLIICDHMTVRDVALKVGLEKSGSTVSQIFNDAISAIVERVGSFCTDLSVPRKDWSRPRLLEQNAPFMRYTQSAWYAGRTAPRIINKNALWPAYTPPLRDSQIPEKGRLVAEYFEGGGKITQCRPGRAFYYKGILGSGHHTIYVGDEPVELSGSHNRIDFYVDDKPVARVITVPAMPCGVWTGNIPTAAQVIGRSWPSKPEGKPHKIKSHPFVNFYVYVRGERLYVRDCGRNYPRNGVSHPLEKLVILDWYDPLREQELKRRLKLGQASSVRWGLTDQQYELIKAQAADRLASQRKQPATPGDIINDDDDESTDKSDVMDVAERFEQEEAKTERGFLAEDPPY